MVRRVSGAVHQRFAATGAAPRDRFESWRAWCTETIDVPMRLEPARKAPFDFDASIEALAVGEVDFVEHRSGPAVGSWTREAARASGRLRLMMVAPSRKGVGGFYGEKISLERGAAVLVSDTDGLWETTEWLHGLQVNVPREAVEVGEHQLAAFNDQRRLPADPVFAGLVRPALLGMSAGLGDLGAGDLRELPDLWISLLAMLARSLDGRDTVGAETAPARWLQVRRHIRANLGDPRLSPGTIAEALFVSRSTLYAAAPADSEGVAAEIRRQRLARAHALLRDPESRRPIAAIAAAVGIPDAGRFSRAFRERYGVTPREVRSEARRDGRRSA